MNPDDFLVLAVRLSASSGESERRTAISRAYYAVFHKARVLVEGCGIVCPPTAEVHDKLARCLQNAQDADLAMIGDKLNMFRSVRNTADYRLNEPKFGNSQFVALQLAMARETADALAASPPFGPPCGSMRATCSSLPYLELIDRQEIAI